MAVSIENVAEGVGLLRFENGSLNVLSRAVYAELGEAICEIRNDERIRAVVIHGAGAKAFSVGDDVKELRQLAVPEEVRARLSWENDVMDAIAMLSKPIVGVLHGYVLGGGLELALCCDLRVADETCRLGFPEVKLGLFPGSGGMIRIGSLVSTSWARRLVYLGEAITAADALTAGLVDEVVGCDPLERGCELACALAGASVTSMRLVKEIFQKSALMPHDARRRFVLDCSVEAFQSDAARQRLEMFGGRA